MMQSEGFARNTSGGNAIVMIAHGLPAVRSSSTGAAGGVRLVQIRPPASWVEI